MPFKIIRNDITKIKADAIVNAANNQLLAGGGVCGAIFEAAGFEQLQKACKKIGSVETGEAVITKGFQLPAKYIIHTAGPRWSGGRKNEEQLLYSCYQSCLALAKDRHLKSIAFPVISSGIYRYPKAEAIETAVRSIGDFLVENEMDVTLVVFDKETFALSEHLYQDIKAYITNYYTEEHVYARPAAASEGESCLLDETVALLSEDKKSFSDTMLLVSDEPKIQKKRSFAAPAMKASERKSDLAAVLENLDESFSQCLLRMIDERGMTDVETYKRANIDRKLFSRIRKDNGYKPKKTTAVAFAIALELSLAETNALLSKAGYVLSHSSKFDVIIEYFIVHKNYKIMEINEALFAFDQVLIGG